MVMPALGALGDSAKTALLAAMLAVAVGVFLAWIATAAAHRRHRQQAKAHIAPTVAAPQPAPRYGPTVLEPAPPREAPVVPFPRLAAAGVHVEQDRAAPPDDADPEVIRLNSASYEELREIEGIDSLLATRILAYRRERGAFRSLEEVERAFGLPPARLAGDARLTL